MYLSRLTLNLRSREVRRDLADCHGMHRTLLKAFPAKADPAAGAREDFGMLYRVECSSRTGRSLIYVQSAERPDWAKLPQGYLAEGDKQPNPACKEITQAYQRLQPGTLLCFALKANPTRKTGTASKAERLAGVRKNGCRVFIKETNAQVEWLRRKGEEGGFALLSVKVDAAVPDLDTLPEPGVHGKRSGTELTFGSISYQGHLQITDADRFRNTLARGLGSGKAYGFGLLTIAPPR